MTAGWDLVQGLLREDPTRPRLVHYDLAPGGLRVELGGRTLANWVAKIANLLVDECDLTPGDAVVLDLPVVHWRTATWVLGCWAAGGTPCAPEAARDRDPALVVTAAGNAPVGAPGALHGALSLPALARTAAPLPPGALDLNADVQGQSDHFAPWGEGPGLPLADFPAPTAPLTERDLPTLDALTLALVAGLPARRPVVLVSAAEGEAPDAETLGRISADERLGQS